jgi:hypothetical protein
MGGKRIEVAVKQHRQGDPAHHPSAVGHAAADAMLDAPIAQRPLRLARDGGRLL